MSAVIGVCTTNLCLFLADKRMVEFVNGTMRVGNDNTEKVFRFNDKLLFGATGTFSRNEGILSLYDSYDCENLTMTEAANIAFRYLNIGVGSNTRQYIFGGLNDRNEMCIRVLQKKDGRIESRIHKPQVNSTVYVLAVPDLDSDIRSESERKIECCLQGTRNMEDIIKDLSEVIHYISEHNLTVGKEIYGCFIQRG